MKKIQLVNVSTLRPFRWLYQSKGASYIWLVARLWLGYKWLDAGWQKMFGAEYSSFWNGGKGVAGFATSAQAHSTGAHASVVYGWWVSFMTNFVGPNHAIIAKLVTLGELAIGLGLIIGLFTGVASFFGVGLNIMYLLSGTIGVNPIYLLIGVFLIFAWQNAGNLGADRYVLPYLLERRTNQYDVDVAKIISTPQTKEAATQK
jgi:thiosulfate dehydrogenase [quinone] large subunit